MDTALYYTFSTISQTLAGAIALLGAFVLYRFQLLGAEADESARHIRTFATGDTRKAMDLALLERRTDRILEAADKAGAQGFSGGTQDLIEASQSKLRGLLQRKRAIYGRLMVSVILTVGLVGASVVVLSITPYLAPVPRAPHFVLGVGLGWFGACLWSYVSLLRYALE
jgi:hypothetical protein